MKIHLKREEFLMVGDLAMFHAQTIFGKHLDGSYFQSLQEHGQLIYSLAFQSTK